jgi:predicted protein tyrosine phosphatase
MTDTIAPFRITICGIEELAGHRRAGVSHVLSILDPDWPVPDAFGDFGEHRRLELRFHDVIEELPGTAPPRAEHVDELLAHCHAGVSRSTASMALILAQALPGLPAARILGEVLRIRPRAWPNLRLLELGDAMLGRGGEMVAAACEVYRRQLAARPELAEHMAQGGRQREVAAANGWRPAAARPLAGPPPAGGQAR